MALRLGIKTASKRFQLSDLTSESTLAQLKSALAQLTGMPEWQQQICNGFPPTPVSGEDESATLEQLQIRNGDMLVVKELGREQGIIRGESSGSMQSYIPPVSDPRRGCMVRVSMPGDNSCLFHCIAYTLDSKQNGQPSKSSPLMAGELREKIANLVASDPSTYNASFLEGRSNREYQSWIQHPDFWGGAIELMIFSRHFAAEIVAYDLEHLREDVFGEGRGYSRRCFVIYNGQHYDCLAYTASTGSASGTFTAENALQSVFSTTDKDALRLARRAVEFLHQEMVGRDKPIRWRGHMFDEQKQSNSSGGGGGHRLVESQPWTCSACTFSNASANSNCEVCGSAKSGAAAAAAHPVQPQSAPSGAGTSGATWRCSLCTLINQASSLSCQMCGAPQTR